MLAKLASYFMLMTFKHSPFTVTEREDVTSTRHSSRKVKTRREITNVK